MNEVECWYHYFLDRQACNNYAAYFFSTHWLNPYKGIGFRLVVTPPGCDHNNSIGLKSGEYGDKLIILAPTASIVGRIEAILSAGRLSITTTVPTHIFSTNNFSINTSNALPCLQSFIVINATTFLILIAPIAVIFAPR
jgi:hypothetical protein